MKHFKTKIGLIVVLLTLGIFAVALANDGSGAENGGYMMGPGMMGYGMGYHRQMMGYGMGYGGRMVGVTQNGKTNLSKEDSAKLQAAQKKFYNDTQDLRNSIEQKELALRQELQKETPDRDTALNLQKELSKLQAEFAQKSLEHRLDLRKTFPDLALGWMGHGHRGGYWW